MEIKLSKAQKYSVIGGSGFIGTSLCRMLEAKQQNFEIIDLKLSGSFPDKTTIADVRDYKALKAAITGDLIINLAAVHRDNVREITHYYDTNVDGARNICTVAGECGIEKIIFTSTVAVYGITQPDGREGSKLNPTNHYGKSKLQAEEIFSDWFQRDLTKRHLTIVRPTVVFGEGNRGNVYNLLNQVAHGPFFMIGHGDNRKSMAYVGNVAAFLWHMTRVRSGKIIVNYVDKPDYSMRQLVEKIRAELSGQRGTGFRIPFLVALGVGYIADVVSQVTGYSISISAARVKKFCATTSFDSDAHTKYEFEAPFSIDEGLSRTLDAEFNNPSSLREIFYTE